ncbi:VQ motif-containing protein 17 [Corylus avellana]|uniref:VQ motif-containing protein 17 n=1 Tax=Corylus avellana TaxID=13451 RepID=UPI001E237D50|nr:VQ motif-containing protein 17 [Corylus avellana]
MEEMTKRQSCRRPCSNLLPGLAMHQDSKQISKPKPKIRIIHIFAPEIIKTDVANFRELVQRLTGKPTEKGGKKKPKIPRREEPRSANSSTDKPPAAAVTKKMEGMWNGENSGGFLGGFADLEGFIQDLGELPFLPLDASSHMHGFGEAQLA